MIGNAWQSLAQVVSDDTLSMLHQAGDLRDKEVKRVLAESSPGHPKTAGILRRRTKRPSSVRREVNRGTALAQTAVSIVRKWRGA